MNKIFESNQIRFTHSTRHAQTHCRLPHCRPTECHKNVEGIEGLYANRQRGFHNFHLFLAAKQPHTLSKLLVDFLHPFSRSQPTRIPSASPNSGPFIFVQFETILKTLVNLSGAHSSAKASRIRAHHHWHLVASPTARPLFLHPHWQCDRTF